MVMYLIGGIAVAFMVVLAYGAITGRVRMNDGCCCPTDPGKDLRTRDI